ncbi:hypothetical protein HPB48_008562 [Haemaphysalis longicornis]|uniref:Uncharacterized protein n=1 Tax=Haemaphysalis longicornis TaxID=44386 RepID=A0A9J6G5W6_HAELO|nr:hypothetical protein HPB48_008562 [Haemaphysalis longicornis]
MATSLRRILTVSLWRRPTLKERPIFFRIAPQGVGDCHPLQQQHLQEQPQQRGKSVSGTGCAAAGTEDDEDSEQQPPPVSCELREVASQFVSDLIHRAREVAQRQQFRIDEVDEEEEEEDAPPPRRLIDLTAGPIKARACLLAYTPQLPRTATPPEIQVDLVGSRTPSPEEEVTYVAPERVQKKKVVVIHESEPSESEGGDDNASDASPDSSPRAKLITTERHDCQDIATLKNDPELREFAVAYIKGILEQAQVLAQERCCHVGRAR